MDATTQTGAGDSQFPARKIHRLLAYVENLGLDPVEIAASVGLDMSEILDKILKQQG